MAGSSRGRSRIVFPLAAITPAPEATARSGCGPIPNRLVVVINAKINGTVIQPEVASLVADAQDRRGLLAALVSTSPLARFERCHDAPGERPFRPLEGG